VRHKVNVYLPDEVIARYRAEAEREGVSLSARLVQTLAWRDQIDQLQTWMAERFDGFEARLNQTLTRLTFAQMLAATGLDQLPEETLLAILRDLKEEVQGMTDKQREHYAAKGREMLAKMNGNGK
jgi:hypothetical protein